MPSLRELQTQVMDALLDEAPTDVARHLVPAGASALPRLQVYRGHVAANFIAALRSTYPAVCRLVGEDYFRQTAAAFQRLEPSRSGDLAHAGRRFPDYLWTVLPGDYRHLADVARLEWLIQESLLAAEHARLDLDALGRVDVARYGELRVVMHPSLRLFESRFPALEIWQVNVEGDAEGNPEPPLIDLGAGGERLAIMRCRLELQWHRLSTGEHAFLDSLSRGDSFASAVESGGGSEPQFDAAVALQRFVAVEAIVDFDVPVGVSIPETTRQ